MLANFRENPYPRGGKPVKHTAMTSQTNTQWPHGGEMLRRTAEQQLLKMTRIARLMEVTHSTLLWYFGSSTVRMAGRWRASLAMGRNFFYDIGMRLPADLTSSLDTALSHRAAELEAENERLRIENETYRKILTR